jgi:translation initiation factor 3 subunit J
MADDWAEDDWESAPAPAALGGGAALDDWEDEDIGPAAEPADEAAAPKPSAPMKPSKAKALALKEKENAELALVRERALAREKRLAEMDDSARKLEMQRLVEESDLEHAKDLFMGGEDRKAPHAPAGDNLHTFSPITDADLAKYAGMIAEKCATFNKDKRRTARYMVFVKEVVRGLTDDLNADDAKELATHMSTISNLKLEESKKARGGKKKVPKRTAIRVERDDDDNLEASYDAGGYDDFM